jgi:hypothetical protein
MVVSYPITESMATEVRQKLEQRRGKMTTDEDCLPEETTDVVLN